MGRILIVFCLLLSAACASSPAATLVPTPAETADAEAGGLLAELVSATALPDERPTWIRAQLTDARTGQIFTLESYAGRTIMVQPMSVGCGECFVQAEQIRAAAERLNPAEYVFISVSTEAAADLAAYADQRGFAWQFASVPLDFLGALTTTYGEGVVNFANAPHFVISPSGAVSNLSTGWRTADQLIAELTAASGA